MSIGNNENRPVMVTIDCITYNHEPYIRQCLDGFVMQKTNFRFEAIVHDDASTDGTAGVIREYAEKYPDIIKPIYETENQYTKGGFALIGKIMREKYEYGKYIAECEGDDYWTDPLKLQKQVDFLESHPQNIMVCNRAKLYSNLRKKIVGEIRCYNHDRMMDISDVIRRGGLFIPTCSVLFRKSLLNDNMPSYYTKCHVGDYPFQIFAALNGPVYYMDEAMSVYRIDNPNSWAGKMKITNIDKLISDVDSEVRMLEGFSHDYPVYAKYFSQRVNAYVNMNFPQISSVGDKEKYLSTFKSMVTNYTLLWKFDLFIRKMNVRGLTGLISKLFLKKYHERRVVL